MKITDIAEQQLIESPGATVYVAFRDEKHVGLHVLPRWESTSDAQWAARQADKLAADEYEDIVVLGFTSGRPGFEEVHKAKAGRNLPQDTRDSHNALLGQAGYEGDD